jgi:group I intron endonuclease
MEHIMDDTYLIYKHTSPSGKSYIGQTNDYRRRCSWHQTSTGCRRFATAIKKYGWSEFQHEILMEGLSLGEANHWESALILEHNTLTPNGYNLTTGGDNKLLSEETKSKISAAKLGKKRGPNKKQFSEETKSKMSSTRLGKIHSDETKYKVSISRRNMTNETRVKMSKAKQNMSEETKAKMSEAKLGKKRGPYKKKVLADPDS